MRIRAFSVAIAFAIAAPSMALAESPQCSAAAEEGQQLRASGRWLAAREKYLQCSASTCPTVVKNDCARSAADVLDALPTIVVDARDLTGKGVSKVRVFSDDALIASELDGRAIPIDPGPHKLRFEVEGQAPVHQEVLAKENTKDRRIVVTFGDPWTSKPATRPSRGHTIFPWILVGAGTINVAVGAVLVATAPALPPGCDAETNQCTVMPGERVTSESFAERRNEAGRHASQPVAGAMVMGMGAAVIVGGLIWHFLEPTAPKTTTAARIRFTPSGLAGTF
jgi:hypothetical protein